MREQVDAIIIGAGHNGLTCACYLAAAGVRVRVFERRGVVGGAAVTEEFLPGFRNSTASYTVSLLHPKVVRDLRLHQHGLRIVERPFSNFLPLGEHSYFKYGGSLAATQAELARFSTRDAERLPAFYRRIDRLIDALRALLLQTPPNVGGGFTDLLRAVETGRRLARLDMAARRDLVDVLAKSAGDVLDWWFEAEPLKAALGFDAVVGNYASPYAPGSAYVLAHHALGEVNGKRGTWGHAIGGMGAITQAMAAEARARGVRIDTNAPVARVLTRAGAALGVVLENGAEVQARCVVANVNPKLLYLGMIERPALDADFIERIERFKCASATFRMNVALAALPDFTCLPGRHPQPHHSAGIVIAPSLHYMDAAYMDARRLGWSRQPVIEMLIPSSMDDTLSPPGLHVASLFCQHFAPVLPAGRSWDEEKEAAADLIIDTVNACAPNFKASVLGRRVLSPVDLEREFGLVGGDIFHGALSLDQLYSARPVLGYGDYRGPLKGLYLCGSGAHPGGGVTGLPGHNAAREILRDFHLRLPRTTRGSSPGR